MGVLREVNGVFQDGALFIQISGSLGANTKIVLTHKIYEWDENNLLPLALQRFIIFTWLTALPHRAAYGLSKMNLVKSFCDIRHF